MRAMILFCLVPAMLLAQEYYETSGSTSVFDLKAGATAPPASAVIKLSPVPYQQTAFRFVSTGTTLRVVPHKTGILALYSLGGRLLETHKVNISGAAALKRPLRSGVYLIRFKPEGLQTETARLVVAREGRQR